MTFSKTHVYRVLAACIVGVLAWVCIAYIVPGDPGSDASVVKGEYRLTSIHDGQENLFKGPVYFEFSERHSGIKGNPVFKLHFITGEMKTGRGFGFVIPLPESNRKIDRESYRVTSHARRFSNKFESVFGYADLIEGENRLYFTEAGSISISNATDREVAGEMDMVLRDSRGKSMRLTGRFKALPLYSEQSF